MSLESTNQWTIENLEHYYASHPQSLSQLVMVVEFDLYKGDSFRTHVKYLEMPELYGKYTDDAYINHRRDEIDKAKNIWLQSQEELRDE